MARQVPELSFERDTEKLIEHYKEAFKEVVNVLSTMIGVDDFSFAFQQSLFNQISFILTDLDEKNRQWCEEQLTKAFVEGQAKVLLELGVFNSLTEATQGVQFSMLGRQMLDAHISDTYEDLLSCTKNTERKIKQLVKRVVSSSIRRQAMKRLGRKTMERDIVDQLTKAGLSKTLQDEGWIGIVDKSGRRWNLTNYVRMVVNTKIQQAHIEGVRVEGLERGIDTAIISSHNAEDACKHFEGMVISLNGLTPGLLTYEELRQSNLIFHPNCQHTVNIIRDISLLPPQRREKHEEQMKHARAILAKGRVAVNKELRAKKRQK